MRWTEKEIPDEEKAWNECGKGCGVEWVIAENLYLQMDLK